MDLCRQIKATVVTDRYRLIFTRALGIEMFCLIRLTLQKEDEFVKRAQFL